MAATNYTPIILYHSTTASAAPTAGNLNNGELAINITDGKLFYKDNGGVVQVIATKGTGVIGGSDTQVQYNSSGALAGSANFTFNGTTASINTLNLTTALAAAYGGTGQSSYTTGDIIYATGATALSKLTIGANTTILTSNGSAPQWSAASAISVNTATNLAGGAAGSLPYQSGAGATTFLSIGSTNRVLTSSGSAPQWVTALSDLTGVSSNIATLGGSGFTLPAVLSVTAPAKLYINTSTVTDGSSAIGATNTLGAITSFGGTTVAATNANVTYTNLGTLVINAAPTAGTNVTITNPYALYVAAGASYFASTVTVNGTVNATTLDLTNLEVTNIKAKDGTAAMSIADSTGVVTFTKDEVVNGVTVGRGSGSVSTNTAVGLQSLNANTTGSANSAVGYAAMQLNITGGANSSFGYLALQQNTSGDNNTGIGNEALRFNTTASNNTAVGYQAGYSNTTGTQLSFFGKGAGYANTGNYNTFIGFQAGDTNTTGQENTAVGNEALGANQTGSNLVAIGSGSLFNNTASDNTAVGTGSLFGNTTGSANTAIGKQALQANTTASNNTAVGYQANYSNTTGNNNTSVGYQSGYSNTTGDVTAFGIQTLYSNTTGEANSAFGSAALFANTTGNYNVAVGQQALRFNTTASNNTAVGYQAGYSNVTGGANTFVGKQAGYSATGIANTFIGQTTGYFTTGSYNTFVGTGSTNAAGDQVTAGSKNTILGGYGGNQGGLDIRTSSNNIVLSDGDGNPREYISNLGTAAFTVDRTSSTNAISLVLRDNVTGSQTNGVYKSIRSESNAGSSVSEIRFIETDGSNNNTAIAFATADTAGGLSEKVRVLNTGAILAFSGASTNANGTGVGFPSTQSASTDPNVLDDYEEGTWTPTLDAFTIGNGTATGYYTKIGNLITCNFIITFGSTSSITGTPLQISGLPVNISGGVSGSVDLLDSGTQQYLGVVQNGNNTSTLNIRVYLANSTYVETTTISSTVPFTWTTNDAITGFVSYRAL